jgi:ribonucleoside-diphosphate reductase alpha chain
MSNLCQEITLPTKPITNIEDENGEISLCTLAAINQGKIKKPSDFEKPCTLAVRALDALLDYQDYPVKAAYLSTMARRPLGIGLINYAYWLAKNGTTYSVPDLSLVHDYAEAWSFYLIKASVELAEEFGPCPKSNETLYHQGIMPIDTYKKDVDELVTPDYKMPWDDLREYARQYGIRNSTLMALMPAETSAQI